jgi:hypothetical protein
MMEGLEAFNALVDKVLAYRPKQKKQSKKANKKVRSKKMATRKR